MNSTSTHPFQMNETEHFTERCLSVHNVTPELRCNFVKTREDCTIGEAFISYITLLYCTFGQSDQVSGLLIILFWMMILFIALGTTADSLFCPALTVIAKIFGLSENLAGVTILAFGNGSPDIFTALAGAPSGRTELVYGELFGSGMFVTTVIAGTICICCPFVVMDGPFLRDTIFYIGASFWTFYIFFKGKISMWESIGFIVLYIVYITVVVGGKACKRWNTTGGTPARQQMIDPDQKRTSVDSLGNVHRSSKSSVCVDLAVHAEQIIQLALLAKNYEGDRLKHEVKVRNGDSSTTPLLKRNSEWLFIFLK